MTTIEKTIYMIHVLLDQLEQEFLNPSQVAEDVRTDFLKSRLDKYKDKVGRLKTVLRKHQQAERRKSDLNRENKKRNG